MLAENLLLVVKFAAVGCLNTLIDWAVYYAIIRAFPEESSLFYSFAKGFSYFCGIVNSYFLNRSWTFKAGPSGGEGLRFARFTFVNAAGLGINTSSLYILLNLNFSHAVSLVCATFLSFVFNFTMNKVWVFRKGKVLAKTTGG